jgi:hypothetical protein
MKNIKLILVCIVGFLIGAFPYYLYPLGHLKNPGISIWEIATINAFLASLTLQFILKQKFTNIPLAIIIGFDAALMGRIVYDGIFIDNTSHNLWPFELIMFGFPIIVASFGGTLIAWLIQHFIFPYFSNKD